MLWLPRKLRKIRKQAVSVRAVIIWKTRKTSHYLEEKHYNCNVTLKIKNLPKKMSVFGKKFTVYLWNVKRGNISRYKLFYEYSILRLKVFRLSAS